MDEEFEEGELRRHLDETYGIVLPKGRMFANGKKVFLYTGKDLPVNGRHGIYIGSIERVFRPSVYVSQLAKKNFVELDEKEAMQWMCGLDVRKKAEGYHVIIKYGKYILGVGKAKEEKIINNLPKNRRLPLSKL